MYPPVDKVSGEHLFSEYGQGHQMVVEPRERYPELVPDVEMHASTFTI